MRRTNPGNAAVPLRQKSAKRFIGFSPLSDWQRGHLLGVVFTTTVHTVFTDESPEVVCYEYIGTVVA
jgi:hypothetical protein